MTKCLQNSQHNAPSPEALLSFTHKGIEISLLAFVEGRIRATTGMTVATMEVQLITSQTDPAKLGHPTPLTKYYGGLGFPTVSVSANPWFLTLADLKIH